MSRSERPSVAELSGAAAIAVEDLRYTYPDGTRALTGVSFSVPPRTKLVLLGPNGAGKSTLLLHLNGVHLPQHGRVLIGGRPITPQDHRWASSAVGLVFQDPDDQLFAPTVWEDVAFGPENLGLPPAEVARRVESALAAVGLTSVAQKLPQHLSLGQKKLAAIAGVLALRPAILVLDEPTAYLDPRASLELFALLDRFHAAGATIVVATHDVDLAAEWANRCLILESGRVLAEGGREILLDRELMEGAGLAVPRLAAAFAGFTPEPPLTVADARQVLTALHGDPR
ncbi:MAG TPA: ATP-binding cassette domain-containing protein [Firmicutes bacterium]|nr:ATP-binding cassette domain-containing protein [Bacillota bacterium]